jgi:tRNA dimethylallyltransferase
LEFGIRNLLIVIVGPTASGKTELAVQLAEWLGTEIISADSRQFYREMTIGTAPPDAAQLARVRHHFVGSESVLRPYDIARYESDVLHLLNQLFVKQKAVILVGGSGLYVDAVCHGIDKMPGHDEVLRRELNEEYRAQGISCLQEELLRLDPVYFNEVDQKNPARLLRAIEVCRISGKPYSSFRKQKPLARSFQVIKIGLEVSRGVLTDRIDKRLDSMMAAGLLHEAQELFGLKHLPALNTVGYSELFGYLEGKCTMEEAVEKIRVNTRRYAKRQMTWFRRDREISWFNPSDVDLIKAHILSRSGR